MKETKRNLTVLLLLLFAVRMMAADIRGKVVDAATKEPLIGATVQLEGTKHMASADINGAFAFKGLAKGKTFTVLVKYVAYVTKRIENVKAESNAQELLIELDADGQTIGEVTVVAKKNLEGERALNLERVASKIAIENMGAKEMSIKGIGNVQEGVKKLTGISIADAGQLIVRGLGDRYSTTTLNGLPIASPNPDNKLIPLDIFPSSTVQNITVSKVYDAEAFADYSGAHIDVNTKENVSEDFFNISLNVGGALNTIGNDRYQMNRDGSMFKNPSMDKAAMNMTLTEFDTYVTQHNIFNTTFDVEKKSFIPDLSGSIGAGKNFEIGDQTLSILAALTIDNSYQNIENAYYKTMEATGNVQSDFSYDSFQQSLNLAALGNISYTLRKRDMLNYTFFYAREATDTYQRREGNDAEGHELIGSNNVTHIYSLMNHQLNGTHYFGQKDQWQLTYSGSYSSTGSDEPDRRQVMFLKGDDGSLSLFKLNRQETMRYFGELNEEEWNANAAIKWNWTEDNSLKVGVNYKDKDRDYIGTRFYYNVNRLYPDINDIYTPSGYLNKENVSNGTMAIERKMQPKDSYLAGNEILAGYVTTDIYPLDNIMLNVGLRYEYSKQWVRYATDGGEKYGERRDLDKSDIFPTVNVKYTLHDKNIFRLSMSRTVTRPQFIEMAPFLYQESYGSAQIRGNEDLMNGYNYNFDLRYEHFGENNDMISVTGYFKYLDDPIERVQGLNGGATVHTFENAESGIAAGVEFEAKKQLWDCFRVGANVSYMYTTVKLPEGGAYTNDKRSLQGASPILVNADLTYSPMIRDKRPLNIALLYNLQGSRIHAVGVSGLGDVKQNTIHTLNLNVSYDLSDHFSLKLQAKDLLDRDVVFRQDIPITGEKVEVERYKKGASVEIGFSYKI